MEVAIWGLTAESELVCMSNEICTRYAKAAYENTPVGRPKQM